MTASNSPQTAGPPRSKRRSLASFLATLGPFRRIHRKLDQLEHLTHGSRATFVGNNRVLVKIVIKGQNIAYFVEADDLLVSPWFIVSGTYETPITNYLLRALKPDSHCLDIGSNFGYYACLMARFCPNGRIVAVEPDDHVFPLLRDNIAINGFHHAAAIHAAACEAPREITLYRRCERSANTSIIRADDNFTKSLGEKPVAPFSVAGRTIDSLLDQLAGRIDFIKVDVEGAEPLVIAGAQHAVSANPGLTIIMEWSPGQIQSAGFDLGTFLGDLRLTGLLPFDVQENTLSQLSFDELLNLPYRAGIVLKCPT